MGITWTKLLDVPPDNLQKVLSKELAEKLQIELEECGADVVVVMAVRRQQDKKLYNKLRWVWNLDKMGWPVAIVRPRNANQVSCLVKFAVRHGFGLCCKTAGAHSSHGMVDDCLCVNLTDMRKVVVDPIKKTAVIQGGAMIGDVDAACRPHGLALPMGQVHHTGVAGMALNATSGIGYLARTRGLSVTWLQELEMVLATGEIIHAVTKESHPDLFWGCQGAGSNFGICTKMTFSLTKIPRDGVVCGDIVKFPIGEGPPFWNSGKTRLELLMNCIDYFKTQAPDEVSSLIVLACGGPVVARVAYIPQEQDSDDPSLHERLQELEYMSPLLSSEMEERAQRALEPLRTFGTSLMDTVKRRDYHHGLQRLATFPSSYYSQKAANCMDVPKEAFAQLCELAKQAPYPGNTGTAILVQPLGGAAMRNMKDHDVPTANTFNKILYWVIIVTDFPRGKADAAARQKCIDWCDQCLQVLKPYTIRHAAATVKTTAETDYWDDQQGKTIGGNEERLVQIKNKYDPTNVFCYNRNVPPTTVPMQQ